jgi:hypothetical protein
VFLPAILPVFLTDGDESINYTIGLSDRQFRYKPLAPVFESGAAEAYHIDRQNGD